MTTLKRIRFHVGDPAGKEPGRTRFVPRKLPSGGEGSAPDPDLNPDDGASRSLEHPHRPWLVPGAGKL